MQLSKIRIKNYRLLIDAQLDVDSQTTLIVGRNNTAKTSCFECISTVLCGKDFTYNDYPLDKRTDLYNKLELFMKCEITFDELAEQLEKTSIEFWVDYSLDDSESVLGALSPFIIDVDIDTTIALICAVNKLRPDEKELRNLLENCYYKDGSFLPNDEEVHDIISSNFNKLFEIQIYAINPKEPKETQKKSRKELSELFPYHIIHAERTLGEDGAQTNSLEKLISSYFDVKEDDLDPSIATEILSLRKIVTEANKQVQKQTDGLLSTVVGRAIGFGYPNSEELQLGVTTQLHIDDQIKNQTILSYSSDKNHETLPSTYNGLGYKNLIKMEFMLAAFARDVKQYGTACIPLLFIEEPESHMHPQMQHTFADYLESFLKDISVVHIQTFLTSHSAHIANTMEFSKIRYAQKNSLGVTYKNLNTFVQDNPDNIDFIRKYLTLTRCDLFFADKIIFVEGASERLLLPNMIEKCEKAGAFDSQKYKLSAQYYALIEIGGAYAHKFIPFVEFLGLPCLILTDLDSIAGNVGKDGKVHYGSVPVYRGETTSNETIKMWARKNKGLNNDDKTIIPLTDVMSMTSDQKTRDKCHLEFQTEEQGLCGHSLEEAICNVNRKHYGLDDSITEDALEFTGKSKTNFALDLIYECADYIIPNYIKSGLIWLNDQKVLE